MPRVRLAMTLVLGVLVAGAAPAGAETIGGTGAEQGCHRQQLLDYNLGSTVTQAGILTSLSFASSRDWAGAQFVLNVVRHQRGYAFRVVGDSGVLVDPGDGAVHTVAVRFPVEPGDHLGVYTVTEGWPCLRFVESEGSSVASVVGPATPPRPGDLVTTDNETGGNAVNGAATTVPADTALLAGAGLSGAGSTFAFGVQSADSGELTGLASFRNPTIPYRDGWVTCFRRSGDRAVFGIADGEGLRLAYREFYVEDNGSSADRLTNVGVVEATPPPVDCRNRLPHRGRGLPILSGDISLLALP